jgi:hypothetical protein
MACFASATANFAAAASLTNWSCNASAPAKVLSNFGTLLPAALTAASSSVLPFLQ